MTKDLRSFTGTLITSVTNPSLRNGKCIIHDKWINKDASLSKIIECRDNNQFAEYGKENN